jgi:hypothetical protein
LSEGFVGRKWLWRLGEGKKLVVLGIYGKGNFAADHDILAGVEQRSWEKYFLPHMGPIVCVLECVSFFFFFFFEQISSWLLALITNRPENTLQ